MKKTRKIFMMTLQEIKESIENLPIEDRDYLFDFLRKKREESRGHIFWAGLQRFRKAIENEGIVFQDEDFSNLRDRSIGREVHL